MFVAAYLLVDLFMRTIGLSSMKYIMSLHISRIVGKTGPAHDTRFKVAVYFREQRIGVGEAASVKKGQFAAAQNALDENQGK